MTGSLKLPIREGKIELSKEKIKDIMEEYCEIYHPDDAESFIRQVLEAHGYKVEVR